MTAERQEKKHGPGGQFLELIGLKPGDIAYNPARPVMARHPGTGDYAELLPLRVESKASDWLATQSPEGVYDPRIELFERVGNNGTWRKINQEYWGLEGRLDFFQKKEDPFIAFINGQMIVGCVRADAGEKPTVSTEFYIGTDFGNLQPLAEIRGMKDVRILALPNGQILVSTRPQGGEAGLGKIGFTLIDDLSQLTTERVLNTPIIEGQVPPGYWLGANELHLLGTNGTTRVGVLGHIAHEQLGIRHYEPMVFGLFNPYSVNQNKPQVSEIKIIAQADDWPAGEAKRKDLEGVVFPGSIVLKDNRGYLFAGIGDSRPGIKSLANPFNAL